MNSLNFLIPYFFLSSLLAQSEFSPQAEIDILNAHNDIRRQIANSEFLAKNVPKPPAANMRELKWNGALATMAQDFALGCPDGVSGVTGFGQNIAWFWDAPNANRDSFGLKAVKDWIEQFEQNGWESNMYDPTDGIGYATQMVWAITEKIGCGVADCGPDPTRSDHMTRYTVVCNYQIQGNIKGQNVYETGIGCSSCPDGTECDDGLCKFV